MEEIESFTNVFVDGSDFIHDCSFIQCHSDLDGGAIYSLNFLFINNCEFLSNSGKKGGAIFSQGRINCTSSCFISCYSDEAGAIYNSFNENYNFYVSKVYFYCLSAEYYGAIYTNTKQNTTITFSNTSTCTASRSVGAFSLIGGTQFLKNNLLTDCDAYSDISIFIAKSNSASISNTIFYGAYPSRNYQTTSFALNYHDSPGNCMFFSNLIVASFPSGNYFCLISDSGKIAIEKTCFNANRFSIAMGNIVMGKEVTFNSSIGFGSWYTMTFVGFNKDIIEAGESTNIFEKLRLILVVVISVFTVSFTGLITVFCLTDDFFKMIRIIQTM